MDAPLSRLPARAVGARIKELRAEAGISQTELARLALLHPSNLGKIERGSANPNLDTLTRIAAALDTTVSDVTRYVTREHVHPRERQITAAELIRRRQEGLEERPTSAAHWIR